MCRRNTGSKFVGVITGITVVKVVILYSNLGFKSYCIFSSVAKVISVVIVIKLLDC